MVDGAPRPTGFASYKLFRFQLTRDGHVVVCHDETVDRTTDGHGSIVSMTLDQIRSLNATARTDYPQAQSPLLDEVLDLVAPTTLGVNIELKNSIERYPGLIEAVSRSIDGHHVADHTVISSFNHLVRTWTVDAPNDLREAQAVGVDAVITNDPATAQQVFAGY